MQSPPIPSHSVLRDDPARTAPHGTFRGEAALDFPALTDTQVLDRLHDLFAGRTKTAFGEPLDWWAATFQCDLDTKDAAGVVLIAIREWLCYQPASAELHGEFAGQNPL